MTDCSRGVEEIDFFVFEAPDAVWRADVGFEGKVGDIREPDGIGCGDVDAIFETLRDAVAEVGVRVEVFIPGLMDCLAGELVEVLEGRV